MLPLILHVPHSAVAIPEDIRQGIRLSDPDLNLELLRMTDWFTDELFAVAEAIATTVRFPWSRLVVDPERFRDDDSEPLAAKGMGAIYTATSDGRSLRNEPAALERETMLRRFYDPHHAALESTVAATLKAHDKCVIIDCHSFPSQPLPYEDDQGLDRADICIGSDPFHTPRWLVDLVMTGFANSGLTVAENRPFAGAVVPASRFRSDCAVKSLMIEVNRRLYMDEDAGVRLPTFGKLVATIGSCVRVVAGC